MKVLEKASIGPNWSILTYLCSKIMQACNMAPFRIYFKFCIMVEHNKQRKVSWLKFLENSLLDQMGNFGPIVSQNFAGCYIILYPRISINDFFHILQHDRYNNLRKIMLMRFPAKSSFEPNGKFWLIFGLALCKLLSQGLF